MKNKLFILLPLGLIFFCNSICAQAPPLGTAGGFAVFTAAGAFNNLGATVITGDVGTGAGLFTGFPPGTYSGQSHVADPAAVQAAADVTAAYSFLQALTCMQPLPAGMGNGQVLLPGIYCTGAATTLNGNLSFNAGGDASAIFIVKVDGAFATGLSSHVLLINGARAANIFWQVNGQFDLGDGSVFEGTIIAAGAVNLMDAAAITGRAWSTAGAVSMSNNNVTLPLGVLAVNDHHFSAEKQGATAILRWTSGAAETSSVIERSSTAANGSWQSIGTATPMSHNVSTGNFMTTDNCPFKGNSYYRLKITTNGALASYSEIRVLSFVSAEPMVLGAFPNPAQNDVILTGAPTGSIITLTDMNGHRLRQQTGGSSANTVHTGGLPAGSYFITVTAPGSTGSGLKIFKQ